MKRKRGFLLIVLFVGMALIFTGCKGASELSKTMKEAKKTYDKAKQISKDSDTYDKMGDDLNKEVELNADNLERYFKFVKKASQEVEDVDFMNPSIATLLYAQKTGDPLNKYVDKSGIIKWQEYAGVGTTILKKSAEATGIKFMEGVLPAQKEGLKRMDEALASEEISAEDKEKLKTEKVELEKKIQEMEDKLNSEESKELKKLLELIEGKKKEAGL